MKREVTAMKILLVEFSDSHDEVLLSWVLTLRDLGIRDVHVACSEQMKERLIEHVDVTWVPLRQDTSLLNHIRIAWSIRSYVIEQRISHVVFNTLAGTLVRDAVRMIPNSVKRLGVMHYAQHVNSSSNYAFMKRKIDALIVLAPHIRPMLHAASMPVHVVPASAVASPKSINKPHREVWIAIPGSVEYTRKDMNLLLNEAFLSSLPSNMKFVVLGNAGGEDASRREFRVHAARHTDRLIWFDRYVDYTTYSSYMYYCDYVLPLIHPSCHEYQEFMNNKISGAFSMAWAHHKPMILEKGFAQFDGLNEGSVFYDVAHLPYVLANLPASKRCEPFCGDAFRMTSTTQVLLNPEIPLLTR